VVPVPTPVIPDWVIQVASSSVTTAVVSAIVAAAVYWFLEGRKFKKEQQINYLKERLDTFYSPLVFHFENMRSWGVFLGERYAWAQQTLKAKNDDMNSIMRAGMRFVSPKVEALWYDWQPYSVAATRPGTYPPYSLDEFLKRTEKLHEALKSEREELMRRYYKGIGERDPTK
jgi:hypothetical protein